MPKFSRCHAKIRRLPKCRIGKMGHASHALSIWTKLSSILLTRFSNIGQGLEITVRRVWPKEICSHVLARFESRHSALQLMPAPKCGKTILLNLIHQSRVTGVLDACGLNITTTIAARLRHGGSSRSQVVTKTEWVKCWIRENYWTTYTQSN
jgi:hypothetical protein